MRINICFASDNNYVPHMAASIVSILKNANVDDELYFYILSNKIKQEYKNKLLELKKIKDFNIEYLDINEDDFKNFPFPTETKHITITTYFRYKISSILPNLDKIIYLDCDIIVKNSLNELFKTNIENYSLGGVEDIGYISLQKLKIAKYVFTGFYINAGVLLINLKKWREDNIEDKLFEYTLNNKDIINIADQDVINAVLKDNILALDYKWNVQDSFYRYKKQEVKGNINSKKIIMASKNPAIIHYTFKVKPWNAVKMKRSFDWWYYNTFSPFLTDKKLSKYFLLYLLEFLKGIFSITIENDFYRLRLIGMKFRLLPSGKN